MNKSCSNCKRSLEASLEYFYKSVNTPTGLSSWCKECTRGNYVPKLKKQAIKQNHKYCVRCKTEKDFSEFGKNSKLKSGLNSWCRECESSYVTDQYEKDPHFKWKTQSRQTLRDMIYRSGLLRGLFEPEFYSVLGCTVEEFKVHIESQFEPGMNWENYGKGKNKWQIDHIKPINSSSIEENVNHYINLKPIWTKDHAKKSGSEIRAKRNKAPTNS